MDVAFQGQLGLQQASKVEENLVVCGLKEANLPDLFQLLLNAAWHQQLEATLAATNTAHLAEAEWHRGQCRHQRSMHGNRKIIHLVSTYWEKNIHHKWRDCFESCVGFFFFILYLQVGNHCF